MELEKLVLADEERMEQSTDKQLTISRHVYTHEAFSEMYAVEAPKTTIGDRLKKTCHCTGPRVGRIILSYVPIVKAIRKYKLKENILGDTMAGLTVSFLHLPQAMALSVLASLQPIHGLYATFFPVLVYMLFGTSPYIAIGTNAVMALLTRTVVDREADSFLASFAGTNATLPTEDEIMNVKVGAAMACCFLVGVILMGMGFLKMGFITTYLSVSFVGGFTTGAAFHIASSQVPNIFGIKVQAFSGAGKLVRMYIDLFSKIEQTKVAEVIIAVITLVILLLVKICINERFRAKMKMPVPIDLLVCIGATIISHFAKFNANFGVKIVGPIPSGFSKPTMPRFENVGSFASDAFVMAILSLAMSISLAKLLANKHGQPIDDNQEMIAYGASNFVSGFFFSFPSATAPPRSMILSTQGARTTLNAVTTSVFFLLAILVLGQLFESLPMSVLATMIIVSMKELLLQYRNLPNIWKVNKYDFIIWVVTNSICILADMNYGLMAGVGTSILLTVVRDQMATGYLVSLSNSEDILVKNNIDTKRRATMKAIMIFKFPSNLYFATAEKIKNQIFKETVDPKKQLKKMLKKLEINARDVFLDEESGGIDANGRKANGNTVDDGEETLKSLVLDCSVVTYIDMAGIAMLNQLVKEYKNIEVDIFIAGAAHNVVSTLERAQFFANCPNTRVFVDVFDVLSVLENNTDQTGKESDGLKTKL